MAPGHDPTDRGMARLERVKVLGTLFTTLCVAVLGAYITRTVERASLESQESLAAFHATAEDRIVELELSSRETISALQVRSNEDLASRDQELRARGDEAQLAIEKARLVALFSEKLLSETPEMRKLAVGAVLLALPTRGLEFVKLVASRDPDPSVASLAGQLVDEANAAATAQARKTPTTLLRRVEKREDDAEERVWNKEMKKPGSKTLDMTNDSTLPLADQHGGEQIIGLRFQNIVLPRRAVVSKAYLEFTAFAEGHEATSLRIYGQAHDDAPSFSLRDESISSRMGTVTEPVAWSDVPAWDTAGQKYRTPDLSTILQAVVNREGWQPGGALVFIIDGEPGSSRIAAAYDAIEVGAAQAEDWAPTLYVEFVPG